jgi:membrane protein DedA with SNARE-associated domain
MLEWTKEFLTGPTVPVIMILLFALGNNFLENIFPPAPCDTVLLFIGTLIGLGKVDFFSLLLFSTIGSTLGFILMFYLGRVFGDRIIDSGKIKFITPDSLKKPEMWFAKHGYVIIVANRFLSGTRAVISFFAGMSHLRTDLTILFSVVSSLVWNAILLLLGMFLGESWEIADEYMSKYGQIILIVAVLVILFFIIKYIITKKKEAKEKTLAK